MKRKEVQSSSNTIDLYCPDWISVGDLFSDESSFHGDGQTKIDLERRAAAYDPRKYWNIQEWNLQSLAAIAAAKLPPRGTKRKQSDSDGEDRISSLPKTETEAEHQSLTAVSVLTTIEKPYNPYEGHELAKQLSQSLEDFLMQFPPSTTKSSSDHWIRIANPQSNFRPLNENLATFKKSVQNSMDSYLSTKANLERNTDSFHTNPASITRKLKPDRDNLESTILNLAKQHGIIKGKWMLFPSTDIVDEVWRSVAQKTLEGILGCAAKVAIRNEDDSRNDQRLLCVYTEDFNNTTDIKRVLLELHKSKLVVDQRNGTRAGVIYYKCDAYTHLDIVHGNEFKIKASMYNSKDLFAEMRRHGEL